MKIDKQKIENSFSKLGEDTKGHIDWIIFIPVVGLLLFSLVFVYSASAPISAEKFEDVGTLFSKHLVRVFLGLITLIVFSKIDYHIYEKLARPIFFVSIAMLVGVLIFGETINGAKRWLEIGPINFQPVEFAKFAMVIYFAYLLTQKQKVIKTFADGFFSIHNLDSYYLSFNCIAT
jgi:cell division protein FtsW